MATQLPDSVYSRRSENMKSTITIAAVAAVLFVTGAAAQHEEHHSNQTAPKAEQGKSMAGGMKSQMPQMMMEQNETAKLVDQLQKSFTAIEDEKDPAALKQKLAVHGALLKELQTKIRSQSHRMEMMQHMMDGSMMGGQVKK
jgi:uncharacterized protein HemX